MDIANLSNSWETAKELSTRIALYEQLLVELAGGNHHDLTDQEIKNIIDAQVGATLEEFQEKLTTAGQTPEEFIESLKDHKNDLETLITDIAGTNDSIGQLNFEKNNDPPYNTAIASLTHEAERVFEQAPTSQPLNTSPPAYTATDYSR